MLALIATAALAHDPALDLRVSDALPGEPLYVTVEGAAPGVSVQLAASTRAGALCSPELRGTCLDLHKPFPIAAAVADDEGVVQFELTAPRLPSGSAMYLQAVATGPGPADVSRVIAQR